jgi:hypothetical protein
MVHEATNIATAPIAQGRWSNSICGPLSYFFFAAFFLAGAFFAVTFFID